MFAGNEDLHANFDEFEFRQDPPLTPELSTLERSREHSNTSIFDIIIFLRVTRTTIT